MNGIQHYRTGEGILQAVQETIQEAAVKGAFANGEKTAVDYLLKLAELHFTAARTYATLGKS